MPSVTFTVTIENGNLTSSDPQVATTSGSTATFAAPASVGETYTVTLVPALGYAFNTNAIPFNIAVPDITVSPNPATPTKLTPDDPGRLIITCTNNIPPGGSGAADFTVAGVKLPLSALFTIDPIQHLVKEDHDPTMIFQPPG